MTERPQAGRKFPRLSRLLKVRTRVLIPGLLGGGTMIIFPAASALVVAYIAMVLSAIGIMAWTGIAALATAAAAALIVPVAAIFFVLAVIAAARAIIRIALPAHAANVAADQPPFAESAVKSTALQQSLDDWETDGGPAAPARRRAARRRVRRPNRRRPRAAPSSDTAEDAPGLPSPQTTFSRRRV